MPPKPEVLNQQFIPNTQYNQQQRPNYIPRINIDYNVICPVCGTLLKDNPEHCPNCGKRFYQNSPPIIQKIDAVNNVINALKHNQTEERFYDGDGDGIADIDQRTDFINNRRKRK